MAIEILKRQKGSVLIKDELHMPILNVIGYLNGELIISGYRREEIVLFDDLDDGSKYGQTNAQELQTYLQDNDFFSLGGSEITTPIPQDDIDGLVPRLESIESQATTNTGDIANNASNITSNTGDIATNASNINSVSSQLNAAVNRITLIENKIIKAIWYETIILNTNPDGQTFTVTAPNGGQILQNGWGQGITAIVKEIRNQVPTDKDIPDNDPATPEIVVSATLDALGNGVIIGNTDTNKYSSVSVVYQYTVDWNNYDPNNDLNDIIVIDEGISKYVGHEIYTDTQYTLASPFEISRDTRTLLTNNSSGDLGNELPEDYQILYNPNTNSLEPLYQGDLFLYEISFSCISQRANNLVSLEFDNTAVISRESKTLNRDSDEVQSLKFVCICPISSQDISNGIRAFVTCRFALEVFDIVFKPIRQYKL